MKHMQLCSRFQKCSVNRCPLDPDGDSRPVHSMDSEKTCKAHPRERLAIAETARLEGVSIPGLTLAERELVKNGVTVAEIVAKADERHEVRVRRAQTARTHIVAKGPKI